jgi:heme/copper-type cytochrome/quinol oxidase subunit 2
VLLELARPITLLASMISLLAVFHTAFLGPEADFSQRIYDTMGMVLISAGVSLISGLCFLEGRQSNTREAGHTPGNYGMRITETFPMQVFCWTTGIMIVLFLLAWYLETHCIFSRHVRY